MANVKYAADEWMYILLTLKHYFGGKKLKT